MSAVLLADAVALAYNSALDFAVPALLLTGSAIFQFP